MNVKKLTNIKKVLIVRPDALGDVILNTPAFTALKQRFPEAKFSILLRALCKDTFENSPLFDEILIDDEVYDRIFHNKPVGLKNYLKYTKLFREKKFDLIIYFSDHLPFVLMGKFAGIPYRLGDQARIVPSLFQNIKGLQRWKDVTRHETEQNMLLIEPLGITGEPPEMSLIPTTDNIKKVDELLQQNNINQGDLIIGLHLGTGTGNKPWNPNGYPELIAKIQAKYPEAKIILTGGEKDLYKAAAVKEKIKSNLLDLTAKTTLGELIALIARYSAYISVDTGPFHIAAAQKIKMVGIFTSKAQKPSRWGPWKTEHVIVRKKSHCTLSCDAAHCTKDLCQAEITADEIVAGLEKLLAGQGNKTQQQAFADWCQKSLVISLTCFSDKEKDLNKTRKYLDLLLAGGYFVSLITHPNSSLVNEYKEKLTVYIINNYSPWLQASKVLDIFVRENTNIVQAVDKKYKPSFNFLCLLSSTKLQIPAVMVKEEIDANSSQELIDLYVKTCRSTGI